MPITISDIVDRSLADNSKLKINDRIISINGNEINDFLDLQFHTADEILEIIYLDNSGIEHSLKIFQDYHQKHYRNHTISHELICSNQ